MRKFQKMLTVDSNFLAQASFFNICTCAKAIASDHSERLFFFELILCIFYLWAGMVHFFLTATTLVFLCKNIMSNIFCAVLSWAWKWAKLWCLKKEWAPRRVSSSHEEKRGKKFIFLSSPHSFNTKRPWAQWILKQACNFKCEVISTTM